MSTIDELLRANHVWAEGRRSEDPLYFSRWAEQQAPKVFWIGCCDSRVPVPQVVEGDASQIFVLRNIANLASSDEPGFASALEFAVDVLGVRHVVVCGHENCGGVQAALGGAAPDSVDRWVAPLRRALTAFEPHLDGHDDAARWRIACALNVVEQVHHLAAIDIVRGAWSRHVPLELHGLLYTPADGEIERLFPPVTGTADADASYRAAIEATAARGG